MQDLYHPPYHHKSPVVAATSTLSNIVADSHIKAAAATIHDVEGITTNTSNIRGNFQTNKNSDNARICNCQYSTTMGALI